MQISLLPSKPASCQTENTHLQGDLITEKKPTGQRWISPNMMKKKCDDSTNSLWRYLRRLVFSSFLSLTRLWLYLLENGAFMKLFKNLITAARRMLPRKTNTVRVDTTTGHGISAALNNIPLKLLLSGLLFFDGCGNVVSVVDSIFRLLISAPSNRQNKAHNYSNISTFFNVGTLWVVQVSLKVSFPGTGLHSPSAAAAAAAPPRRSALPCQLPLLPLDASAVPQWGARGGVLASSSSPMTSGMASDTSGPSAGVFSLKPDNAGSALSLSTRQETHLIGPASFSPSGGEMKTEWRSNRRGRYQKFPLSVRFLRQRWRGRRLAVWQGQVWVFTGGGEDWTRTLAFFTQSFLIKNVLFTDVLNIT